MTWALLMVKRWGVSFRNIQHYPTCKCYWSRSLCIGTQYEVEKIKQEWGNKCDVYGVLELFEEILSAGEKHYLLRCARTSLFLLNQINKHSTETLVDTFRMGDPISKDGDMAETGERREQTS